MSDKSKIKFPIDIVYMWVDGSDSEWKKSKDIWQKELQIQENHDNDNSRYVDNQELKYSLRSIAKNAPWINTIYIVTNGQVPKWLDLTKTDKIKIIKHEEIMPKEALPTFNSCAIESCIYNIKGLSEHFLIANDDCFIYNKIQPDFFFDKAGRPIVRLIKRKLTKEKYKKSLYSRSIYNTINLVNKRCNTKIKYCEPHHNIDAYTITDCKNCVKIFENEFQQVIFSKFRNEQLQRICFALYMLINGSAVKKITNPEIPFRFRVESDYFDLSSYDYMQQRLFEKNPVLLCINDEPGVAQIFRNNFADFLEGVFPDKQIWEKEDSVNTKEAIEKFNNHKKENIKISKNTRLRNIVKTIFNVCDKPQGCEVLKKINILGNEIFIKVFDIDKLNKNYDSVIKKLRFKYKKNKIRVAFIVSENSKWSYQALYEIFEKSEFFEPIILVTLLTSVHKGIDKTRYNIEENYNFFKQRNMRVDYLYKNGKYRNLNAFKPDMVFYEQPWDIYKKYRINVVSKYALTFYNSYSYEILDDTDNYFDEFHGLLYTYFIEHELNLERYKKYSTRAGENCYVVGSPKLDLYFRPNKTESDAWKNPNKIKIIYAPHHSFDNYLQLATFDRNGKFILELAKKHPETSWVFKPHPRLKLALLKTNLMNEDEVDKYYDEWRELGTVYMQGDYIDIFKNSDAMITDSLSFLAEYLPSEKPLLRIINANGLPLNSLGNKLTSGYYEVETNRELEKTFEEVVLNHNDSKKALRLELIKEMMPKDITVSEKIFNYILNILENK